jgi:hypothetical protein
MNIDRNGWELVKYTNIDNNGEYSSQQRCIVKCPVCKREVNKPNTKESWAHASCRKCFRLRRTGLKVGDIVGTFRVLGIGYYKESENTKKPHSLVACKKCGCSLILRNQHIREKPCPVCLVKDKYSIHNGKYKKVE